MAATEEGLYRFGPFTLNVNARELTMDGTRLTVGPRAFHVLTRLVRQAGEVVTNTALLDTVWDDRTVEVHNVTVQIRNLRKLLAKHHPDARYIENEPGRGYVFVASVQCNGVATDVAPVADALPTAPGEAEAPSPPPVEPGPPPERHNLPAEPSSFVGRAAELAEITRRLRARAMVTLTGSGGVGKTRCALRAARAVLGAFPDGVWLAELAPLQDGALVAEAVCRAVGAPVSGGRPAIEVGPGFLRQKSALLILDNCEHLADAAAELASALLKQCPGVTILATSRQPLGIAGESVFRMPSLPLPPPGAPTTASVALEFDAVRLFVERAADFAGGYELTDHDAAPVMEICRHLDGVPMATELAAARLRVLKPSEIAARLADVFGLLTGGSKGALPRQKTLRATIDWSFNLLSPPEQMLLPRLAVFVDGFSLAGATAVGAVGNIAAGDILDLVSALVDKSLLSADQSGVATRYRLLETTRHYALEKLAARGEHGALRRMAAYLADFYARGERIWGVTATETWLAEFGSEVENLRAAIDWAFGQRQWEDWVEPGDPAMGIALVAVAGCIAEETSMLADMRRWTEAALPHIGKSTAPGFEAWVLYWSVRYRAPFGVREVSAVRQRMIELFRDAGDAVGLSCALRTTGLSVFRSGEDSHESLDMLEEAVSVLRPLGPSKDLASALAKMSSLKYMMADYAAARSFSDEAMAMSVALGDRRGLLVSFMNSAEYAFGEGNVDLALDHGLQGVEIARNCHAYDFLAMISTNVANYLLERDRLSEAEEYAREALALHRNIGNSDYAVVCLEHLALIRALGSDYLSAARILGYTESYFEETGQVRELAEQRRYSRLREVLSQNLSPARIRALEIEGSSWSAEEIDVLAVRS